MSTSSWRTRLTLPGNAIRFAPPADEPALEAAASALGVALPAELRTLLREANGITDRFGSALVWPAKEIGERNRAFRANPDFRTLYMPFDALLFFGDAGDGDQFFYRILDGAVRDTDIFVWAHETDSRTWSAASLESFLVSHLRGAQASDES